MQANNFVIHNTTLKHQNKGEQLNCKLHIELAIMFFLHRLK